MSSAAALQPATEDSFCVYGFPFVLRTNHSGSRDAIPGSMRNFCARASPKSKLKPFSGVRMMDSTGGLKKKPPQPRTSGSALWGLEAALCEAIIRSQQHRIAIHAATLYSVTPE